MHHHRPTTASPEQAHGHNYLASAADLMVGLLFVFIIMVAFLAYQRTAEVEAVTAAMTEAMKNDSDPRGQVTSAIGASISTVLTNVRVDPASGVITLPEDLLFDRGSAQLKVGAVATLAQVATLLDKILPCYIASQRPGRECLMNSSGNEIETIFIEGHTDSVPMLRDGGNAKLSLDRAISVERALVAGTVLGEYRNAQGHPVFSYSAYADNRPLKDIDPTDGRNRRVDLRVVLAYRRPTMSPMLPGRILPQP